MKLRRSIALASAVLVGTAGIMFSLYVNNEVIHDGDTRISIRGLGKRKVVSIDRLTEGYLVGTTKTGPKDVPTLHIVDISGDNQKIASAGDYDINLSKDRIVAIDSGSLRAMVFSSTGTMIAETTAVRDSFTVGIGVVEDEVLMVTNVPEGSERLIAPEPRYGRTKTICG